MTGDFRVLGGFRGLPNRIRDRLRRDRPGSLLRRLSTIMALGVGLSVILVGTTGYLTVRGSLFNELDRELVEVSNLAASPIRADVEGLGGLNVTALQTANVNLVLLRADGTMRSVPNTAQTVKPSYPELAIARTQMGTNSRTIVGSDGRSYRQVAVPMETNDGKWAIILVRPLEPTFATLHQLRQVMLWMSVGLVVLAAFAGAWAARQLLRPLHEMGEAVARVTETDELTAIGTYTDDELGQLARNFDTMMHSLASSRERQKRLIADAGHELRTPLTSMRTNIELLVADENSNMLPPGARGEILTDVAAQLGEFTALVGDLVQLSRDEIVTAAPEPLDFADVIRSAVARARRRGPRLTFDVELEPFFVVGEPDTLERAITNLLDNAVKFSPDEGTVWVHMADGVLTIADEGPGISEEDLPKLFDRFYRSNKARNTPGTGLGLSIVAHTVNAHGGTIEAGNSAEHGGAQFILTLPAAPADAVEAMTD